MKRTRFMCFSLFFLSFWLVLAGWTVSPAGAAAGSVSDLTRLPPQNAPTAPSELKASSFPGALYVELQWEDKSTNETGFTIERSSEGGSYSKAGTVGPGVTSYTDMNVIKDTLYSYRVYANGTLSKSGYSNVAEWTTFPYTPTNLKAEMNEMAPSVYLQWNGNNKHATFQIQKTTKISADSSSIELINLPGNSIYYEDTNVKPNTTYTYMVMAINQGGRTDGSNLASIKFMAPPTNLMVYYFPASTVLSVKWQDNNSYKTGFVLERAFGPKANVDKFDLGPNTVEYIDQVQQDTMYMYRVKAIGPDNQYSPYSEVYIWYSPPRMPDGLKAEAVSSSEIKLTWNDRSEYETGFMIWRSGDNMMAPLKVGANTTSYSDTGLKPNTKYSYTIKAVNDTSSTVSDDTYPASATTPQQSIVNPGNLITPKGGLILPGLKLETVLQIGSPAMTVNGVTQEIDPGKGTAPVIVEGRTLLPVRAIIEAMNGTVAWDGTEKKVTVVCNARTVELWIGSKSTRVNGESKTTDVAPQIINDRTMLPVRFISENLGLNVDWDAATSSVTIKAGS